MKQSKSKKRLTIKDIKRAKLLNIISLIIFFLNYILLIKNIFTGSFSGALFMNIFYFNAISINRYIGLLLAIYNGIKYKEYNYAFIVMILLIFLQTISLLSFIVLMSIPWQNFGAMG